MKTISQPTTTCSTTIKLLGDYWTLRIIDTLKYGELRFCELQRLLNNVNPVTLTNRLKKLETAQLIRRCEATQDKISVSYALTNLGREALPILVLLDEFAIKSALTT